jgi:hypothetical protein
VDSFQSAVSMIIPFAIGQAFGNAGGVFYELARAGAQGLGNGLINSMSGGDFWQGVGVGAAASIIGSGAKALHFGPGGVALTIILPENHTTG